MKKFFAIAVILGVGLFVAGCGGEEKKATPKVNPPAAGADKDKEKAATPPAAPGGTEKEKEKK